MNGNGITYISRVKMEKIKAKWHGMPYFDTAIRKWLVSFELDFDPRSLFDKTRDQVLSLTIKQWREGRSLNANKYFHVLVQQIAEVLGVAHFEVHKQMIADYGYKDETIPEILLREDVIWERIDSMHLRPRAQYKWIDGELFKVYDVMRGSHTYDTKEMSRLIDGVVFEAQCLGIETMTPSELERMKQLWTQ